MARIRSIKPEFWTDRKLARLSRDARLLYIALWNQSDEHGRLHGDTRYVKGHCLPYDDDLSLGDIERLLGELEDAGRVQMYESDDDPFIFLPRLASHQRLEASKQASRLPEPPKPQVRRASTKKSAPSAGKSAQSTDEPAPIVAQQVAGSRWQGAGSREQVAGVPPTAAPASTALALTDRPPDAGTVVAAYVDAVRTSAGPLDNRAKGRIAKDAAALLADGAPVALLIDAAQRLAVNGYADLGAEARRLHGERSVTPIRRPSASEAAANAALEAGARVAARHAAQEGA